MNVDTAENDPTGNNVVATGALFMLLSSARRDHEALTDVRLLRDESGDALVITFAFLDSPYRVTVERIRSEDEQ